jgi:DTW domain-containing protein YfiP
VRLVIWQHPSEENHPKGTASLLHACLPNSQLVVSEQLNREVLLKQVGLSREVQPVLLFPSDNHQPKPVSNQESPAALLALDGTWRKARKLLYLNPWLLELPRLSLDDLDTQVTGNYRVRKAEKPGQLSTLESCCMALAQMEQNTGKFDPILTAFEAYMQQLEQFRPNHGT